MHSACISPIENISVITLAFTNRYFTFGHLPRGMLRVSSMAKSGSSDFGGSEGCAPRVSATRGDSMRESGSLEGDRDTEINYLLLVIAIKEERQRFLIEQTGFYHLSLKSGWHNVVATL